MRIISWAALESVRNLNGDRRSYDAVTCFDDEGATAGRVDNSDKCSTLRLLRLTSTLPCHPYLSLPSESLPYLHSSVSLQARRHESSLAGFIQMIVPRAGFLAHLGGPHHPSRAPLHSETTKQRSCGHRRDHHRLHARVGRLSLALSRAAGSRCHGVRGLFLAPTSNSRRHP